MNQANDLAGPVIMTGRELRTFIVAGTLLLETCADEVNALNVFPVPDGDTGTNMMLTMQSAVKELEKVPLTDLSGVAAAVARGALLGARGNSGVILSQLFRGLAHGLEGKSKIDGNGLARAIQEGVEAAYRSVMKPVEGTILTVAKEGARGSQTAARLGHGPLGVLGSFLRQAEATLTRTPEYLPVLKQAGVVDAGGRGLICLVSGGLEALQNGKRVEVPAREERPKISPNLLVSVAGPTKFPYCTELMIHRPNVTVERMRLMLVDLGDSLVVAGDSAEAKVHVHTDHPGTILELGLSWGEIHSVKIDNMKDQHQQTKWSQPELLVPTEPAQERELAVIAVSLGKGIEELFNSLGVDRIVDGGQTMNPSTEDILRAITDVRAKHVLVLPNNSNIVLTAHQAAELAECTVEVVPTKTVPQGIAAALAIDRDQRMEWNAQRMWQAAERVHTVEVTYAVRDSKVGEMSVRNGDILGLIDDQVVCSGTDPTMVALTLLDRLVGDGQELVTILYGSDLSAEKANRLGEELCHSHPELEVEVHSGGQPLYYYIIGVE